MRLRIFQAEKGDCILVTSSDNLHMLADGGMSAAYTDFVAPVLNQMHNNGEELDLVYISHIDQDHISGILTMLNDLVDWRVFEHHGQASGAARPNSRRPPEIQSIWHNAFHEQISKNRRSADKMFAAMELSARAMSIYNSQDAPEDFRNIAIHLGELVTSINEAIRVSRRVGDAQLGIPLNPEFGRRLMFVSHGPALTLGNTDITVIGPFSSDLEKLKDEWVKWLRLQKGKRALKKIRRDAKRDEDRLNTAEVSAFVEHLELDAEAQKDIELANRDIFHPPEDLALAKRLGRRSKVTTPNLASLMLLLEDSGRSVLMTGDGHGDDIIVGLNTMGKLDANGQIHVDVLKVQHHGSEHNIDETFCQTVIADEYVFCGNGEHENPELDVIQAIVDSRLPGIKQSTHRNAGSRFKLWFSASSRVRNPGNGQHMLKVEQKVRRLRARSNGQMLAPFFLRGASFTIDL